MVKLLEIADVFNGILKHRLKQESKNDKTIKKYYLLNYACFDDSNYLKKEHLTTIETAEVINSEVLVQKNDIIAILLKPIRFYLINEEYENMIIPSNIAIIRTKSYDPTVLIYLLNQQVNNFNKFITGISIPLISIKELRNMEIDETKFNDPFIIKKVQINELLNHQLNLLERKYKYINQLKKYFFKKEKEKK